MFIDANIFLEIALQDTHKEQCKQFIHESFAGKTALHTSDFVLYSCLLIIFNRLHSAAKMRDFLVFLNTFKIQLIRPSLESIYTAMKFMEKYKLDFDDALVVSCMTEYEIDKLVTYDQHFDQVEEITVHKP